MERLCAACRVLIVDDNVDAADLVAELMAFQGYEVAVAHGGEEVVKTAQTFEHQLIFLDLGIRAWTDIKSPRRCARQSGSRRRESSR
nr:response regulator [Massilia sp. 9096]